MKTTYYFSTISWLLSMTVLFTLHSCNKYLDREPLSNVTPQEYLNTEADLAAYTVGRYAFPSHSGWGLGTFANDNGTDNQVTSSYSTRWVPGEWRVPSSGGEWDFTQIRQLNYFLEQVLPKWKNGKLTGNSANITHYVGEAYFLRAYEYFNKVQALGDFPIIRNTLKDNMEELTAASIRQPRNMVVRFILSDLDSAITLLNDVAPDGKNRISKKAALLFKSRVGLFEGSWLKYHKGTAFVPGGTGWPGAKSHPNFSINIDNEINYFLEQSMTAAAQVADAVELVGNTKDDGYNSSSNPYFKMFGDENLNGYSEVLLWRSYSMPLGITHAVNHYMNRNGGNSGYSRGLVENFTMKNGLPIYASNAGYAGDDSISLVKKNRDNRLQLFMKAPGELSYTNQTSSTGAVQTEPRPDIIGLAETRYVTGYAVKKGMSYLFAQAEGQTGTTGSIIFRAVEAYLNYIEASYLAKGVIDAKANSYWTKIRERAGVNTDFMATVNATDMQKEAQGDFAAYSAGQLLSDKLLYNIRRERRLELVAEGFRFNDLRRWRALDQLANNPYIIEGMRLWGPMQDWYKYKGVSTLIVPGTAGKTANVSSPQESQYLRPYRINLSANNLVLNGYSWTSAHYLSPIAISHLSITSTDGSPAGSIIYQNPNWPLVANQGANQ
ncbi:RagB/SusD family nutrient uptake outer membrane protein [Sphingobacterium sp. BIGb0116]|uniref:RagB/SusD family nutrient uptake outer membrane protein n=1 Tax=Sphingobacterium sp. BIGb0116 TaxID=2940619 RepID=UPI0021679023|nr:RagB/SusD family nutrient uptake outer membrane protein [Sphingobacterium sp. BIGb0116]MCS4163816.1 hypothetical protein [Sphingobacterium sp. BIGb0116]